MAYTESLPRQLSHIAIQLECKLLSGQTSSGTGFFFDLNQSGDQCVPVIMTNRHVVEEASEIKLRFTLADQSGAPIIGKIETVIIQHSANWWLGHPDLNIDLAAIPIAPIFNKAKVPLYHKSIGVSLIPSAKQLDEFDALEDIILVGYPIGISDSINNMPLFRKGITATRPSLDYEGRREFVIDAACFPGSSGSPVFRYKPSLGLKGTTNQIIVKGDDPKLSFLGILYAGPQYTVEGKIEIVTIPTKQQAVPISRIPTNLGYVIKADCIREFEPIIKQIMEGAT